MKERIQKIRKDAGLNQEDFAKKIGLSKNYISLIETGNRIPSDRTISDICREFDVKEEWLREGVGPIYVERDGSFTELLSDIDDSDDDFIKNIIKVYMTLDKNSKEALKKITLDMAEKYKRQD